MQHGSKIIPADKVREICPKRKLIRDEVRSNIKISAKKMAGQYDKRIQVKEFSVGDSVTIKIPPEDRQKTDPKRLLAKIIKVSGNIRKLYQLQCTQGIINCKYGSNDLELYPGTMSSAELPTNYISLRTAVIQSRAYSAASPMICHCKSGCKDNRCRCRTQGVECTSRCHSGMTCENNDEAEI